MKRKGSTREARAGGSGILAVDANAAEYLAVVRMMDDEMGM